MKAIFCVILVLLTGCTKSNIITDNPTVLEESRKTEENHRRLVAATPPPQFEVSQERQMLVKRLKTLNVQNKVMYICCLGMNGNVVYTGQVMGKVSSINSLLTTPEQIIRYYDAGSYKYEKLPSPDFDGSYGPNNSNTVFWFDPNGAYFEYAGSFILSDRPFKVNTPISLQAHVDLEK